MVKSSVAAQCPDFDLRSVMGDDVVDLPVMNRCGLAITVPDAPEEVKARCQLVTRAQAGRGAAREACELIMRAQGTWAAQLALYDR